MSAIRELVALNQTIRAKRQLLGVLGNREKLEPAEQAQVDALAEEVKALDARVAALEAAASEESPADANLHAHHTIPHHLRAKLASKLGSMPALEIGDLALSAWLRGPRHLTEQGEAALAAYGAHASDETFRLRLLQRGPRSVGELEKLAQSKGVNSEGGYLVMTTLAKGIEIALLNGPFPRELCTVLRTTTGENYDYPTTDDTGNTGELTDENATASGQDIAFGKKTFSTYKYTSGTISYSWELEADASLDFEALAEQLASERIVNRLANVDTVGTGSGQPSGITLAGTGKTAASQTAITYQELIDLRGSINSMYRSRPNCAWMFGTSFESLLYGLLDGNDRPLWGNMVDPRGERLLGYQIRVNDHMPAVAASARVAVFGDFSKYFIRETQDIWLEKGPGAVGAFQIKMALAVRHDAGIVNAGTNPIKRLVMAAA